jgi:hypothetical protein
MRRSTTCPAAVRPRATVAGITKIQRNSKQPRHPRHIRPSAMSQSCDAGKLYYQQHLCVDVLPHFISHVSALGSCGRALALGSKINMQISCATHLTDAFTNQHWVMQWMGPRTGTRVATTRQRARKALTDSLGNVCREAFGTFAFFATSARESLGLIRYVRFALITNPF